LTDPIVEFVLEEPPEQVERFAAALEKGSITLAATRSQLKLSFAHGPRSLERMVTVLSYWRALAGTEVLLAGTLRGQLEVRRTVENRGPRCELVWTGETKSGAGVRSTFPVVKEMVTWARRSVFLVTYSLWIGTGDAGTVIDLLADRSSEGVDVTFVLDARYLEGRNVIELKKRWPSGKRRPSLFTWQDELDPISKLHAKVVIVDRRDLLITSANLTGHGMKHNLELGLRVLGKPGADAADHFDNLVKSGAFKPVAWS